MFCKVIRHLKLDFNIAIFVTGIENIFKQTDLMNFIYLLRSVSLVMPPYMRFVLTMEKRASKTKSFAMIPGLLVTQNVIDIVDKIYFENESRKLAEFAYSQLVLADEKAVQIPL